MALAALLLASAVLQLVALDQAPVGLNQDEASNAWDAWNLLHTGHDQHGVSWPVFYLRAFGENRSPLYAYLLIPFQWIGGLNVWTTRLPNVAGGLSLLLLTCFVASRLFDRMVGLVAAAALLITPWHLQLGRWGHEGCLTAFLCTAPVAAWLWAGLPIGDRPATPRAGRALLAGLLTGLCCYGYPAVRLFLPVFGVAGICLATPWKGARATARSAWWMFAIGLGVTFGPLAAQHLLNGDEIAKRAAATWAWLPTDPLATRVGNVALRYVEHFGADFLFLRGDLYLPNWPGGSGVLNPAQGFAILVGVGFAALRWRSSASARLILLWLLCYPLGDCLSKHAGPHVLRAAAGTPAFAILTGFGVVSGLRWLAARRRFVSAFAVAAGLVFVSVERQARFAARYFGSVWKAALREPNQVDFLEAARWLRPRLDNYAVIAVTPREANQTYAVLVVGMAYDARRWQRGPRETRRSQDWDTVLRFGHVLMDTDPAALRAVLGEVGSATEKILFLQRPEERPGQAPMASFGPGDTLAAYEMTTQAFLDAAGGAVKRNSPEDVANSLVSITY